MGAKGKIENVGMLGARSYQGLRTPDSAGEGSLNALPFRTFVSTATDPEVIQRERKAWNDASNPIVRAIRAALPGNFL